MNYTGYTTDRRPRHCPYNGTVKWKKSSAAERTYNDNVYATEFGKKLNIAKNKATILQELKDLYLTDKIDLDKVKTAKSKLLFKNILHSYKKNPNLPDLKPNEFFSKRVEKKDK